MKTTIVDTLKDERGTRLTYGNRWIRWDKSFVWGFGKPKGAWVVCDYRFDREHKTQILATTEDVETAVKYLLYKEVIK
jgi:hypothetical protein